MSIKRVSVARPHVLAIVLLCAVAAKSAALVTLSGVHQTQLAAVARAERAQEIAARQAREADLLRTNASLETESAP